MNDSNELESLKHSVMQALKRSSTSRNGRFGHVKSTTVDIPFSKKSFQTYFTAKIPKLKLKMNNAKSRITVEETRLVLGADCTIFKHKQSSTQQRLIGPIKVHYRPKLFDIYSIQNCPRYLKLSEN